MNSRWMMGGAVLFGLVAVGCGGKPARDAAPPVAPADAPDQPQPVLPNTGAGAHNQPQPVPEQMPKMFATYNTAEEAQKAIDAFEDELTMPAGQVKQLGLSRCARLCRSLGSMRRAVDGLCELTGEDDERCGSARQRLEVNEGRVEDAGCSC